jgi:hypothetical protein
VAQKAFARRTRRRGREAPPRRAGTATLQPHRSLPPRGDALRALALFGLQMAFNVVWTPAFFGAESPALGLGVIAVL